MDIDGVILSMRRNELRKVVLREIPDSYRYREAKLSYRVRSVRDVLRIKFPPKHYFVISLRIPAGVPKDIKAMIREAAYAKGARLGVNRVYFVLNAAKRLDRQYALRIQKLRKYQVTGLGRRVMSYRHFFDLGRNRAWLENMDAADALLGRYQVDPPSERTVDIIREACVRARELSSENKKRAIKIKVRTYTDLFAFRQGYGNMGERPKVFRVAKSAHQHDYCAIGILVSKFLQAGLLRKGCNPLFFCKSLAHICYSCFLNLVIGLFVCCKF